MPADVAASRHVNDADAARGVRAATGPRCRCDMMRPWRGTPQV